MARPRLFETRDRYGREIELPKKAVDHIIRDHPEVTLNAIRATVEQPQFIFQSAEESSVELFFRQGVDTRLEYNPLTCKVAIGFWGSERGRILTAMYQPGLQGSRDIGGMKYVDYSRRPR